MSTNRLEAFSDGVLAVAITLLVLNITVPPTTTSSGAPTKLGHELLSHWPQYAAYITSFITIGIIWINHHAMIGRLRQADRTVLGLNLVLLMTIGVLPFATSLMAAYLKEGHGEHIAAAVYAGAFLAMSLAFITLNRHILLAKPQLLQGELSEERRRTILRRSFAGVVPYVLATGFAFVSPYVTLAICFAIAAYYALPIGSGGPEG